ncbi:MAG TPA: hypothetical protein VEX37_05140 [Thermomicrobiales bacterium]|nr:hypothetical protein [Thermomicrobiales bacterium]
MPRPTVSRAVPPGAVWNGMTLPAVPAADWPASLVLDHSIDRVVRDALSSGRSIQEAVTRVSELAQTILPHATEAEINQRVHAQLLANT